MLRKRSVSISLVLAIASLVVPMVTFAGTDVPFKSEAALLSAPAPTNSGCPSYAMRMNVTGTGTATHMGALTISEFVCLTPWLAFTAEATLIAASGDSLFLNASGNLVPSSPTEMTLEGATFVLNGGTGRFAGATGGGNAYGTVDMVTGASPHRLEGTISTVGSQRR